MAVTRASDQLHVLIPAESGEDIGASRSRFVETLRGLLQAGPDGDPELPGDAEEVGKGQEGQPRIAGEAVREPVLTAGPPPSGEQPEVRGSSDRRQAGEVQRNRRARPDGVPKPPPRGASQQPRTASPVPAGRRQTNWPPGAAGAEALFIRSSWATRDRGQKKRAKIAPVWILLVLLIWLISLGVVAVALYRMFS